MELVAGFFLGIVTTGLCYLIVQVGICCFKNDDAKECNYSDGETIIKSKVECIAENIDTIISVKEQNIKDYMKKRENAWVKIQESIERGLRSDKDSIEIKLDDCEGLSYSEIRKTLKQKGYKVSYYLNHWDNTIVVIKLR